MIKVFTTDSNIWHLDKVILDIVQVLLGCPAKLTITMTSEGPCLQALGLYKLLDEICSRFNYPKQQVYIYTANMLESHSEYQIVHDFNFWELEKAKHNTGIPHPKLFDQQFKHFGSFVGHGNRYRLQIASHLFNCHLDKTLQTYHYRESDPYHREFIGIEDMLFYKDSLQSVEQALNLLKHSPITLDHVSEYPIMQPANLGITRFYNRFFVEIVNLTYFTGNVFYIDEKIYRPMLMKTPFMIQGPADTIKNLRRLGFKTFDSWWDEGYSEDPDGCQIEPMINNINQLSQTTVKELQNMYNDMLPVLEHNRNLLLSITKDQIEHAFK